MAQNIIKFESSIGTRFYATGITSRETGSMSQRNYGGPRSVCFKGFDPEAPEKLAYLEVENALGLASYTRPGRDPKTGQPYLPITWKFIGTESIPGGGR